jgi:hypothetical protein
MSIVVNQTPNSPALAQSPLVFSVADSNAAHTGSGFQFVAKLYMSKNGTFSATPDYQMNKYPNMVGAGIFDFSKLISSKLRDLVLDNPSQIVQYKLDLSSQWYTSSVDGNILQTGPTTTVSQVGGVNFYALDGYYKFPQSINPVPGGAFPLLTDAVDFPQYVLIDDIGYGMVWASVNRTINYSATYENGTTSNTTYFVAAGSGPSDYIKTFPIAPGSPGFPLATTGLKSYSISLGGFTLRYEVSCASYWDPIRIAFKNRFGGLDWITFSGRSDRDFATEQRVYQPQLGSWNASTLSYNTHQARTQRYIVDATEKLLCNTDWINEGYNELFKQLLLSDEIYYYSGGVYTPLSIITDNLRFKTSKGDKLIQYTIEFGIGQSYKQII